MMSRKRGEEPGNTENLGPQSLRSAKEKGSQAAAAAIKLEKFAHTPEQSPTKNGQAMQVKAPGDRKSQGQASSAAAGVGLKSVNNKGIGMVEKEHIPLPKNAPAIDPEPTLR